MRDSEHLPPSPAISNMNIPEKGGLRRIRLESNIKTHLTWKFV